MKYHYTYRLVAINPIDERTEYIGVRSCECLPEEDTRYQGSSKHLPRTVQYRKEIIAVWQTRKDAVAHEVALHDLHDVARSPKFFNKAKQKSFRFDTTGFKMPLDAVLKISAATKKAFENPEYRKARRLIQKEVSNRPQVRANNSRAQKIAQNRPEVKQKMSLAVKAALSSPEVRKKISEGTKAGFTEAGRISRKEKLTGKVRSQESRLLMSKNNAMHNLEHRKTLSDSLKKVWSDESKRAEAAIKSKIALNNPDVRFAISSANVSSWQNPVVRAKRIAGIKAAIARKKNGRDIQS